ncbi:hypothetical protein NDU88_005226 [Pleurodeles waltl]|uniref:Uncharacterized protein n=1 Tax=Pleurodeles waltl TaxID=8319 RepID=A0AAV7QKJ7_PLEWA|nr:hypothetical protein NDU88_005226 [Pleurodeles waltl]
MNPDFRVPEKEKLDDGLRKGAQEEEETEDANGRAEEEENAGVQDGEGASGNSDVPSTKTDPTKETKQEETRIHRHIPGGTWLNKIRSLFKRQDRNTKTRGGGEENEEGGGGLERGTTERVARITEKDRIHALTEIRH